MKKIFTFFLLAVCACLNAAAQFVPEDGKQYVIKDALSEYYIVLGVGNDSQASDSDNTTHACLGAVGTAFTFTPSGDGFILSTTDGKYLGNSRTRAWNVSEDVDDTVWYIYDYNAETGRCRIYKNQTQGLGLDNHKMGSGIYTDKSNQFWNIEEYVAPEEVHVVTAAIDGVEYTMLEDGEGGYEVTFPDVESGDHTLVVTYDGAETTMDFTTYDYKVFDTTVNHGKVSVYYKDGVITLEGDGMTPSEPEPEPEGNFEGKATVNLTSIASLDELEGMQITLVGAQKVEVLDEEGYLFIQNQQGDLVYAAWGPAFGGTYEIDGNVVTLHNFFTSEETSAVPVGETVVYVEDYGTFRIDGKEEYFDTIEIAYEGAPEPVPFDIAFTNNGVECQNGAAVEANENGVATDFYLVQEGLTAVGTTATLYKDGTAMTFAMTFVDGKAVSFFGGSSLMTEPGTYLLEVPANTFVDAQGNPSNAFYGSWVLVQTEPTYVDPVLKAEDVSAEVAYVIYTQQRGGLMVEDAEATTLRGTQEADPKYDVDASDARQQFAFVNWQGNLYLYNIANEKFLGKGDTTKGLFTEEPVDPILFKNEGNGTVMLYFDDSHNINLGGSKQVTIDGWKQKDAGNSFIISVAEPFDQTALLEKLNTTEWNGEVAFSEASSLDDLLNLSVEFCEAASVEVSGFDVLGAIFDETGDPYAIVMGNGVFDCYGSVAVEGNKVNLKFQKFSELGSSAAAARAGLAKIGGFETSAGKAAVVFAGKSFVVDGNLVGDVVSHEYEVGESNAPTGINTLTLGADAKVYDLQGRRVRAAQNNAFIMNGKKVVK